MAKSCCLDVWMDSEQPYALTNKSNTPNTEICILTQIYIKIKWNHDLKPNHLCINHIKVVDVVVMKNIFHIILKYPASYNRTPTSALPSYIPTRTYFYSLMQKMMNTNKIKKMSVIWKQCKILLHATYK